MSTFPRYGTFEDAGELSITRFKFLAAWARWNKKEMKRK
jgi:predicted sulfurtransferase